MMDTKKDDDEMEENVLPFQGVEKSAVLQERRVFSETPLNPRKCCLLLTKLLYLLNNGETFTSQEATDVFFAVTMLFQSQDMVLRRMTYLMLKELVHLAKDVIIVTQSLMKDINSKNEIYRANSIRVLCKTIDELAMLGQQGERLLRQAIVDKQTYVAASALTSAYRLVNLNSGNADIVKRWLQEISEAASKSDASMVSYHALGLLYQIRKHDRLAVTRLARSKASQQAKGNSSPFEVCLFIRIITVLIRDSGVEASMPLIQFLQNCKFGHTMVKFEAAKALCSLEDIVPPSAVATAVTMLTSMLSNSTKSTARVSALRILNSVKAPVTNCQHDLEMLVSDSNLSVATLAISMLLKTGVESSVESHLKTLSNFMMEISDDFKCNVADAVKGLCFKYPRKKTVLLNFLSKSLRDDGQFVYKSKVVDTILAIVKEMPSAKEEALSHLCEFIEDCEYTDLACRILHLLGDEGPSTKCAHKFIRYIFNRVILENPAVRGAAVQALAKFGRQCPELRPRVLLLLRRCFGDSHAVVRERALLHYRLLEDEERLRIAAQPIGIPLENLENALKDYLAAGPSDVPFDMSAVSRKPKLLPKKDEGKKAKAEAAPTAASYAEELAKIPEFAELGQLICSSRTPTELTEPDTEYVVSCIKHIYPEHIVFQFNCSNTFEEQLLEDVCVRLEPKNDADFEVLEELPLESLPFDTSGVTYVVVQRSAGFPEGRFVCTFVYNAKEVDPSTGEASEEGEESEYPLENLEVTVCDYVSFWVAGNYQELWTKLGEEKQALEVCALSTFKGIHKASLGIANLLHMSACDRTAYVPGKDSKAKHILHLSGKFLKETPVLARARMKLNASGGVDVELTVRSEDPEINEALVNAIYY
mmetsp:Transcript_7821/g.32908  ORF Transcript_7821/g.32908 Transcript_7821/m.32908 type:complete len:875 (-) Transcript_7821:45-2669(-)